MDPFYRWGSQGSGQNGPWQPKIFFKTRLIQDTAIYTHLLSPPAAGRQVFLFCLAWRGDK